MGIASYASRPLTPRTWHPQERDRPLKILGVVLSMALVQTIVVALGTTVSGSVVKAVKRALAQQGGGASLGPSA